MAQELIISINIAGNDYKFKTYSEKDETIYRRAAEQINNKFNECKKKYPNKSSEYLLSLISLAVCVESLKVNSIIEDAKQMHKSLEDYLERIK